MMQILGIIRSSSILVFLLFLPNFTTRSHAQAASDSMDGESTVLGPSLENTTSENFCGPPPRLEYGLLKEEYLDQTIFPRGTEIKYVCRPGYIRIPLSSSAAKCMADTTWSLPNTFCKRRSCGNPGEVNNGEMQAENLDFGSKVTYVCNPGYKIISKRNYRDCQADGKWSNDVPECEVISCPSPPSIENGHYYPEKEDYNYLDSVKYICSGNLVLIGKQTTACTEEGKWSSDAPTCKAVQCSNPNVDNSLKISGFAGPYNMNSIVRFVCKARYKMIGSDTVKCNQSSKWEPELPKCLSVCRVPQLTYAYLEKPTSELSFLEGSTLTFKCKEGYEPARNAVTTVTCLSFRWSPSLEFCERIRCVDPEPVPHGILNSHSFRYGDIITYSCKTGYKIKNVKIRNCQSDRSWSIPIPECEAVTCADPGYVKNGWYSPQEEKYFYNDTITYNCHEGFQPVGQTSITCGNDGRWNSKPECIGVCNAPPHLDYAHLAFWDKTKTTVVAGTKLEYRCIPGYYHDTKFGNTIDCLGNFTWSTISNEFCKIHTCPTPRDIKNGWYDYEMKEYRYNDTITYGCHEGFQLLGQASITCRYGSWNYNTPVCRGICGTPPDLHYAQLDVRFNDRKIFFDGDKVPYNCRPGYIQNYNYRIITTCLGNFTWSEIPHELCNRISCGHPQKARNAQFEAKDFLYESEVIYKCEKGYKLASGSNMVKCESNKRWVGTLPVCEVQKCLPPEDLEDGSYSLKKNEYTYNESVIYKCNTLRLVGKASVSCTDEGKWSSGAPQCKAVCTFPPKLNFAKVEEEFIQQEFFDHGTSVQYKCLPGFVPVIGKNNKLTCLDDLKWSQHEVFCTPISCDHPGNITHGQMQSENFFFGSRVNYTCNPGYSMISRRNDRECQADGTWSGKPPVCKEPVCDKIWELQEEARKCTSTPDEWIKYLQVQYLYLQIENLKLDIEIKKKQLGAPL